MCKLWNDKRKIPWRASHDLWWGNKVYLLNWAISTKLLEIRDKEMYLENCLLLFHSCEKTGLNIWAEKILGDRMDKLRRISSIDWGEDTFSTRQITMLCIEHAVNDALVASHIFLGLVKVTFNPLSQDLEFFFLPIEKKRLKTV